MDEIIKDKNISLKAKGLYLTILELKKYNENINIENLKKKSKNGVESITSAKNELIKHGYLKIIEKREKGKILGNEWVLLKEVKK